MSDALQDISKEPEGPSLATIKKMRELKLFEAKKGRIFEDYVKLVDIHLVKKGMAFKASKSVEFGRVDQSMLNHIRNGIFFLIRFNEALQKLNIISLDETGIRECIALYVVHDLHKLASAGRREEEFELTKEMVVEFMDDVHLHEFAPSLKAEDYYSVAVALHKSEYSRPGIRTSHFMDLEPFLYLMDNMASCSSPEEAVSARSLKALRDGFPSDTAKSMLNLQYHRLDDVKGILTGLLNRSVADIMEAQGLVMLMAYQDGCVYLGKGVERATLSDEFIQQVYDRLKNTIQKTAPEMSDSSNLVKKIEISGTKNYYQLSDEYYFFGTPEKMIRAFLEKALIAASGNKKRKLSEIEERNVDRALKAASIDLSNINKVSIIEIARAVNAIRKTFISGLVDDNSRVLTISCDLWDIPEEIKKILLKIPADIDKELISGGKWEYAYVIAQCVMDLEHNGVKICDMPPLAARDILFEMIWPRLRNLKYWDEFITRKTKIYRDELIEYIHEALSVNGTLSRMDNPDMSDPFYEYQKGGLGRLCNLCNHGTMLKNDELKKHYIVSFLAFNFSNRIFAGKTKPDHIYTCIPCGVELTLRLNGSNLPKGSDGGKLYFHLMPDYFFTPESWELAYSILSRFSEEARVQIAMLSRLVFKSKYAGESEEVDVDIYGPWIKALGLESDKDTGRNIFQYIGQGYGDATGDASMIYYKPCENITELHFFGVYIALVLAAYTGMRVVVSQSPITAIRSRDFKEFVALDSIDSHVANFYGNFIPLSQLEDKLRSASALINLGYSISGLKDSMFTKYLRVVRDEPLPGSHLLKMVYRRSKDSESHIKGLLDNALFLDKANLRR